MSLTELLERGQAEHGLNITGAAKRFGVSRQAYDLWLKGAYMPKPTAETVNALVEFTGRSIGEVLVALGVLSPAQVEAGVDGAAIVRPLPSSELPGLLSHPALTIVRTAVAA